MGAADAAQVASTNYVQSALESLDSSATATEGTALTGITVVDGKITNKTEVALPVDTNTTYTAGNGITLTGTEFSANVASVEAGSDNVTVSNVGGKVTVSVAAFENSDVNGGTADAGTNKLLQSVKLENGQLTAVATVDIVDTYVAPVVTQ